ncbi:hypothetical protein CAAN1_11S00914 [[Candida] anglica]|uniref:Uncharacterized protein n=1 Tax=[Candida] anglica TaxID=148631 RepID=A0ABP0EI95_9ASCO
MTRLTKKPHFSVNPIKVFGPRAFESEVKSTLNTSPEVFYSIFKLREGQTVPGTTGGFIDVKDAAHVLLSRIRKSSPRD